MNRGSSTTADNTTTEYLITEALIRIQLSYVKALFPDPSTDVDITFIEANPLGQKLEINRLARELHDFSRSSDGLSSICPTGKETVIG